MFKAASGAVYRRGKAMKANGLPSPTGAPTFTDNANGTVTCAVTFASACYCGADYGAVSGTYTASAWSYTTPPTLKFDTSHSFLLPDADAGGTLADGTWYARVAAGFTLATMGYVWPQQSFVVDNTNPVLSSPSMASLTTEGGIPTVTTNEGNGTLYYAILTDGGTADDMQIKAGAGGNIVAGKAGSQAVSSTGIKTFSEVTGLADGTAYEVVFLQTDAVGNDSAQSTAGFTTVSAGEVIEADEDWVSGFALGSTTATITLGGVPADNSLLIVVQEVAGGTTTATAPDISALGGSGHGAITGFTSNPLRNASLGHGVYGWWCALGTGMTGTDVVINRSTSGVLQGGAATYKTVSGNATWAVDDIASVNNGSGSNPSPGSIDTTADSTAIIGIVAHDGSTVTAASGYTAQINTGQINRLQIEDKIGTAAGTETPSWTGGSGLTYAAIGIDFKAD